MNEIAIFDAILRELLHDQRRNNPNNSIVVACLYSPSKDNRIFAKSSQAQPNLWLHAERNAVHKFFEQYPWTDDLVMISSLSPCFHPSRHRFGSSCTHMLEELEIKKLHVGHIDPMQLTREKYEERGFQITVAQNQTVLQVCSNLFQYFLEKDRKSIDKQHFLQKALKPLCYQKIKRGSRFFIL